MTLEEAYRRIANARQTGARELDLSECAELIEVSALADLTALRSLNLSRCSQVSDLSPLRALTALRFLNLSWCSQVNRLSPLRGLGALEFLELFQCETVDDLSPLRELTALQRLTLRGCSRVRSLSPLKALSALNSLNLGGCKQIDNLQPLQALSELQYLHLGECEQVRDLAPLRRLSNLQSLYLFRCSRVRDLSPLRALSALQTLDLHGCELVSDLSPLRGLTSLQWLRLSECQKVSDLSPLQALAALQTLELSRCWEVSDLTPLQALSVLKSLNLYGCHKVSDLSPLRALSALQKLDLTGCHKVNNLAPLQALPAMQSLNLGGCTQLSNLSPLETLSALQSLNLWRCTMVSDLSPLKALVGLQYLYLGECRKVWDLSPLEGLTALRSLGLSGYGKLPLPNWIVAHPCLKELYASSFPNVPPEVQSQESADNCLPRLRAWWNDRQAGEITESEVKIFLLGNGFAGKTQLCRFLEGKPFQNVWNSTHGVQLVHLSREQPPVRPEAYLNVWDFGGQDIYHGTHALFLKSRAIFLILWTPELEAAALAWRPAAESETARDYEDRPRPLAYWLHYVRELAGSESPVLVVQSKCEERTEVRPPDAALAGMLPVLPPLSFSARTRYGAETLLGALRDAVTELHRAHPPYTYGCGWVAVRDRCHALRAAGTRTLARSEFDALCVETGGVSESGSLLEVLHRLGVVFHRSDLFGGLIIVDQGWALEAIYTVFHRERCLPHLRGDGTFTRRELDLLAWGEVRRTHDAKPFTQEEQELFLSMMQSCGICFPWRENAQVEQVYLAPELLPPREAVREHLAGRLRSSDLPAREVIFRYRFLHEGVVRELLTTVGRKARDAAVYWRNGVYLYESTSDAFAVIEARETPAAGAGAGEIVVQVYGDRSDALAAMLRRVIDGLGHRPSEILDQAGPAAALPPAQDSAPLATATFPPTAPTPRGAKPAIFISYAWGDETPAGQKSTAVVERLCARLDAGGFAVVRDNRCVRVGDSISEFIKRFGTADKVLAILSDKYLQSVACMTELHSLWQTSQQDRTRFQARVHPLVLDCAKIGRTLDRLARAKHWKDEYEGLLAAQHEHGDTFGVEDQRELKLIGSFAREVSDMLRWLNDELMPRRFENDEDFDGLIGVLRGG